MPIIGAIAGAFLAFLISIPIFGPRGGRWVAPGVIEYDPARGERGPGGCLASLANLIFIVVGAVVGAAIAGAAG